MLDRFLNSAAASMAAFGQVFMAETNRLRVLQARAAAAFVSEDPEVEDDEDDAEEGSQEAGKVEAVLMEHTVACPECSKEYTAKFFIVRDGARSVICKDADEAIAVREGWPHIQVDHTE